MEPKAVYFAVWRVKITIRLTLCVSELHTFELSQPSVRPAHKGFVEVDWENSVTGLDSLNRSFR